MAYENPNCRECQLHKRAKHRCMPSIGTPEVCKLAIYLDYPNLVEDRTGKSFTSDGSEFLRYCIQRMSLPLNEVYFDYIVKCYPVKIPGVKSERMGCVAACSQYRFASLQMMPRLRAMVVLGGLGCEMVTGCKSVGEKAGAEWEPQGHTLRGFPGCAEIWVGYSPALLREKPSEAGSIFRVIWRAAEQAGYTPVVNTSMKPYHFEI